MRRIGKLLRDERAATAVEYGLICALIVVAMIVGLNNFSGSMIRLYNKISSNTGAVL